MSNLVNYKNDALPDDAFPLVRTATDKRAAREAYRSTTALLDYVAEHLGDQSYLHDLDLSSETHEAYTFSQTRELVTRFAKAHAAKIPPRKSKSDTPVVVGVIAAADVDYWLNDRAIQRLGHIPLHLSVTLSPIAVKHLLETNGATQLLVGPGGESVISRTPEADTLTRLEWITISSAPPLGPDEDRSVYRTSLSPLEEADEIACILHSTGSTAVPKPIPPCHETLCSMTALQPGGSRLCTSSTSHALTYYQSHVACAWGVGVFLPPPLSPPSPNSLISAIRACRGKAEVIIVVPLFLKMLVNHPEGIQSLRAFRNVLASGGMLDTDSMRTLTEHGIKLHVLLASTELAPLMNSGPARLDNCDALTVHPLVERYMTMESFDEETGAHRLVVDPHHPALFVTNQPDGTYDSGDLFVPHPMVEGSWKYYRRKDEVITHSSGLKSDPLFIEQRLMSSNLVSSALAVGTGRTAVAVLVIPSSPAVNLQKLQPTIDHLNAELPSQSHIQTSKVFLLESGMRSSSRQRGR